jgi:hypothetical protein
MSSHDRPTGVGVRDQSFWSGVTLLGFAAVALWAMRDLDSGSLSGLGPGGLPRAAAIFVGALGTLIVVLGRKGGGEPVGSFGFRGVVVVVLAILAFAVTIRPFDIAGIRIPGMGMIVSGPLAIFIGGLATPEGRWRELAILACLLTAFCMVLFGDLLALPIPVFPNALIPLFPAGFGHLAMMRLIAAILIVAGLGLLMLGRITRPRHLPPISDVGEEARP